MAVKKVWGGRTLPKLVVQNFVLFPGMVSTIHVSKAAGVRAVQEAMDADCQVWVTLEQAKIGVLAEVLAANPLPDGSYRVALRGKARADLGGVYPECLPDDEKVSPLILVAQQCFEELALVCNIAQDAVARAKELCVPGQLSDHIAFHAPFTIKQRKKLLESIDTQERLLLTVEWLQQEFQAQEEATRLRQKLEEQMQNIQREHYIREHLKVLSQELAEITGEDLTSLESYTKGKEIPADVLGYIEREWRVLRNLPDNSQEAGVAKNYIELACALPYGAFAEMPPAICDAEKILSQAHQGISRAKRTVLEHIAVRSARGCKKGLALLFVGPSGTGKTTFARSVSLALGLPSVTIAAGGMRDEGELRGVRRTYVGARQGRLSAALSNSGVMNPVVILDELDKISKSCADALLDALDPEQNHAFCDSYLEFGLNLSGVTFIATANDLSQIPTALLDRFEVVEFEGYVGAERAQLVRDRLWHQALEQCGLPPTEVELSSAGLASILDLHRDESGLRGLNRTLLQLGRHLATERALGKQSATIVDHLLVAKICGDAVPELLPDSIQPTLPGETWCLLARGCEGAIGLLEVALLPGESSLFFTGNIGDSLKESARTVVTALKVMNPDWVQALKSSEIHLHMPAVGVGKDGPSAGVAIAVAIASALDGNELPAGVACSGELSINGKVLPVGGLRAKILAAEAKGIKKLILPKGNAMDEDLIRTMREVKLEVVFVEDLASVFGELQHSRQGL